MIYYFDGAFYLDNPPDGAVKITGATHRRLLAGQAEGGAIATSDDGKPALLPPARAELLRRAIAKANAETDEKIISGFEYKGVKFWLSLENQMNFKAECDIRSQLAYPVKVKTADGFMEIRCPSEYLALYSAAAQYIRGAIEDGWTLKEKFKTMSDAQLARYCNGK